VTRQVDFEVDTTSSSDNLNGATLALAPATAGDRLSYSGATLSGGTKQKPLVYTASLPSNVVFGQYVVTLTLPADRYGTPSGGFTCHSTSTNRVCTAPLTVPSDLTDSSGKDLNGTPWAAPIWTLDEFQLKTAVDVKVPAADGRTPPNGEVTIAPSGGSELYRTAYTLQSSGTAGAPEWTSVDSTAMSIWVATHDSSAQKLSYSVTASSPDPSPSIGWTTTIASATASVDAATATVVVTESSADVKVTVNGSTANPIPAGTSVTFKLVPPDAKITANDVTLTTPITDHVVFSDLPYATGYKITAKYTDSNNKDVTADTGTFALNASTGTLTIDFP
jgi:hypothetical protein